MRIQHNISALNTHRNLSFNNTQTSKALEKLSSGYKINRAGDDAAGLAISEKMRGQIRGLDMASKNAQDGISLIQTAEGALSETHSILQRMRELAVQAANDTNEGSDRGEIQKEINQLTSEINRIGNTTEFNTKKLVNGGLSSTALDQAATATSGTSVIEKHAASGIVGVGKEPMKWTGVSGQANFDIKINGSTNNGVAWATVQSGGSSDMVIERKSANEFTVSYTVKESGAAGKTTKVSGQSVSFDPAKKEFSYSSQGVSFSFTEEDAEKWTVGGELTVDFQSLHATNKNNLSGTHNSVPTKQLLTAASGTTLGKPNMSNITVAASGTLKDVEEVKVSFAAGKLTVDYKTASGTKDTIVFSGIAATGTTVTGHGISFTFSGGGTGATASGTFKLPKKDKTFITSSGTSTAATTKDNSLKFQIGANQNQALAVSVEDMRSKALGIVGTGAGFTSGLDVNNGTNASGVESALSLGTHKDAAAAITKIDDAIKTVSNERSKLGAVQNRLEHTINNLGASSENLTAAESRIRDTDMAKEMMNFTKNNILTQAAQSMLAQANQQPQGVLQLLG